MTGKLNDVQNSTVINLPKYASTWSVNEALVDIQSENVKPNDKCLRYITMQNKGPLTVSDDQLPLGGKRENVEFLFPPVSIKPFPFPFPLPWN